ncbi:MAG: fibronectin type III domain-containing protein [Eubacteriales bacterium]
MLKKSLTYILVIALLIVNIVPLKLGANPQAPVKSFSVDEVFFVPGQNQVTGKPILRPTISASWEDPNNWEDGYDDEDVHDPDYYEFTVNNKTLDETKTFNFDKGTDIYDSKQVNIHDEMNLDTGSLYEFTINPRHYHYVERDGEVVRELAPNTSDGLKTFAITDLNVELEPSEDEITIIWDDVAIQDLGYRIVYAVGDYSNDSKEALVNNSEGEITNLTKNSDGVTAFYDPVDRRNKLKYTINQNIYPGQIYSIIVEPMMDYIDGNVIQRNRNYPNVFTGSTNIDLKVTEDGDYVRLDWEIPSSFKVGQDQEEYELVEAKIAEYIEGQGRNVVIFDDKAANMEYYKIPKPSQEAEYKILLRYEAVGDANKKPIEPESKKVPYIPGELKIRPTQPDVPKPISRKILSELQDNNSSEELRRILEKEYLLEGDSFNGNVFDLLTSGKTFQINEDGNIQFVFSPFKRRDFDLNSPTYNEMIVDSNVNYDIYVAKNLDDFASAIKIIDRIKFDPNDTTRVIKNESDEIIGYKTELDSYYDSDESNLQNIVPNQLYYIKIVASKEWGDEEARSEANIIPIYFDDEGDIYAPPTIVKPPLKVRSEDATETSSTIEWRENWWEIIAKDTNQYPEIDNWATEIWVDEEGNISISKMEDAEYFPIYRNEHEATRLKQYLEDLKSEEFEYILREINLGKDSFGLSDVDYKFHKIPYEDVKSTIDNLKKTDPNYDINDYIRQLMKEDEEESNPIDWKEINPIEDEDNSNSLFYTEDGLLPNTQYLFLLHPYRIDYTGEILQAHSPTPVVIITEPEDPDISPDPTVPSLYISDYTDISASLSWKYNTDFTYELRMSTNEDIADSDIVEIELPGKDDSNYPTDGRYYEQQVKDLFPNTEYYFWIRAIQPDTQQKSAWSNAVIVNTNDIQPPVPPRGIGLASLDSLKPFDYDENQGEEFLSLEWLLHPDDKPEEYEDAKIKKSFTYIVEISDNPQFIDAQYVELTDGNDDILPSNVEKLRKNLIVVNELIPNRRYYFRLKTRVILEGEEEQNITKKSTYYSPTIALLTLPSSNEYDGNPADELIILPDEYYETIYDPNEKHLTHRFRYNQHDSSGGFDSFIVERLISSLINDNVYEYNIDVSEYKNKPIATRTVEIPYRLWDGFKERGINLTVNTGDTKLSIPIDSIDSYIYQQVNQYNESPTIRLTIKEQSPYILERGNASNELFLPLTLPQEFSMQMVTSKGNKAIKQIDKPISINIDTDRYGSLNQVVEVVHWDQDKIGWDVKPSNFNKYDDNLSLSTNELGVFYSYLTYHKQPIQKDHWALPYREAVLNKTNILGVNQDLNGKVTYSDYLNIASDLLQGNATINLNQRITHENKEKFLKSKILINDVDISNEITRQEAFYMTLKLFQQLTGKALTPSNDSKDLIAEIDEIEADYQDELAIGIDQGFISDPNGIRPTSSLTYGEMFVLLNQLFTLQ